MSKTGPIAAGRLFAAADPSMDPARREVQSIARMFGAGAKVIANRLVTKQEVKESVRHRDVVHLSVHGRFDASEPMLSHLVLRQEGDDDGRLTAAEMFGLPLEQARLVVLSACESARAEATHGNEILGIVRGLLYARAGTLVLSYWKVESAATAFWMNAFYSKLSTNPPSDAARAALTEMKAQKQYAHPFYWAAFMVVGR
jgi:CHAT domain-containing protein